MPRKQRGGVFSFWPFGENKQQPNQPLPADQQPAQVPPSDQLPSTIEGATKQTIHTSMLSLAYSALAAVRITKGAAKGVAKEGEQAGFEVSSEAVKQTGDIGKQAIKTTGELAVASLQGASDGGKDFLKDTIKHALFAAKEVGGAGLMTTESIGKAIESPEVQSEIEKVVKQAAQTTLYATEDVILLGELITKATAKALTMAVQSIALGGGRRRRATRRRSHRLKRRTAKHR